MSQHSHVSRYPLIDQCFFRIDGGESVGQYPSLDNFTVLIDQLHAMFNLSLSIGLNNGTNQDTISIMVNFALESGGLELLSSPNSKIK